MSLQFNPILLPFPILFGRDLVVFLINSRFFFLFVAEVKKMIGPVSPGLK